MSEDIVEEAKKQYNKTGRVFDYLRRQSFLKLISEVEKWKNQAESLQKCSTFKKEYDPKLQKELEATQKKVCNHNWDTLIGRKVAVKKVCVDCGVYMI